MCVFLLCLCLFGHFSIFFFLCAYFVLVLAFLLALVYYFLLTLLHKLAVFSETTALPLGVEVRLVYILPLQDHGFRAGYIGFVLFIFV